MRGDEEFWEIKVERVEDRTASPGKFYSFNGTRKQSPMSAGRLGIRGREGKVQVFRWRHINTLTWFLHSDRSSSSPFRILQYRIWVQVCDIIWDMTPLNLSLYFVTYLSSPLYVSLFSVSTFGALSSSVLTFFGRPSLLGRVSSRSSVLSRSHRRDDSATPLPNPSSLVHIGSLFGSPTENSRVILRFLFQEYETLRSNELSTFPKNRQNEGWPRNFIRCLPLSQLFREREYIWFFFSLEFVVVVLWLFLPDWCPVVLEGRWRPRYRTRLQFEL